MLLLVLVLVGVKVLDFLHRCLRELDFSLFSRAGKLVLLAFVVLSIIDV
jgi:hypothetical protein